MIHVDKGLLRQARALVHDEDAELEPLGRDELLALLRRLADSPLASRAHPAADAALLRYIGDEEIRQAYAAIWKGYR